MHLHLQSSDAPESEIDGPVTLDITVDVCPMTFVRVRLALDRLPDTATLEVRLRGEESRRNVPRAAEELGYAVLSRRDAPGDISLFLLGRPPA